MSKLVKPKDLAAIARSVTPKVAQQLGLGPPHETLAEDLLRVCLSSLSSYDPERGSLDAWVWGVAERRMRMWQDLAAIALSVTPKVAQQLGLGPPHEALAGDVFCV